MIKFNAFEFNIPNEEQEEFSMPIAYPIGTILMNIMCCTVEYMPHFTNLVGLEVIGDQLFTKTRTDNGYHYDSYVRVYFYKTTSNIIGGKYDFDQGFGLLVAVR